MNMPKSVAEQFGAIQEEVNKKNETNDAKAATSFEDTEVEDAEEEISDEVEDNEELEDDVDNEEDDQDEDEELPDPVKEVLRKERKLREDAQKEAKRLKAELKKLKPAGENDEFPEDSTESEPDRFKELYTNTAIKSELAKAGFSEASVKRLAKLVDTSDLEIDEDGNIEGLSDQIEDIKTDFPELLSAKAKVRKPLAKGDSAGRRPATTVPKTSAERLLGK